MLGFMDSFSAGAGSAHAISRGALFALWFRIGAQSFGGGVATQFLIHRAFVVEQRLLTDKEFTQLFAICQIAPGINLFALVILIARKLSDAGGVVVALLGLMLPSVTITIAMTALYARFRDLPVMRAALRGIAPAVAALGVLMCWNMTRGILRAPPARRLFPRALALFLIAMCVAAVWGLGLSPFLVYLLSGALAALAARAFRRPDRATEAA